MSDENKNSGSEDPRPQAEPAMPWDRAHYAKYGGEIHEGYEPEKCWCFGYGEQDHYRLIPESQAQALWEGANLLLTPSSKSDDYCSQENYEKAIALLRKGIGK